MAEPNSARIFVEISAGELIDKITILEIKLENIADKLKVENVSKEYAALLDVYRRTVMEKSALRELSIKLKSVNARLWKIEDDIRERERRQTFDAAFVALARSVYRTNDERAALKRQINVLLRSEIVEEKSYADY